MSKVFAHRNSKTLFGEFGHLQASQAATSLITEIYRLMRGVPVGKGAGLARELQYAAEEIAVKIAQRPSGMPLRKLARAIADARMALAGFEARLVVARSLGYVGDEQLHRLDFFLRYLRLYCAAFDEIPVDPLARLTPNA